MTEEDAKENLERLKAIRGVITKKVQQATEGLGDEGDTLTDEDFQQLDVTKRLLDGKLKKQRKLQPSMKTTRNQHMCVFYLIMEASVPT